MNRDLEATLAELDPGCRAVVDRLRAAREAEPTRRRRPFARGRAGFLVAASLSVAIALSVFCRRPTTASVAGNAYTIAYAPTEEALAALVASQRADGGWANDYLTRQNAAALREAGTASARVAYRRAVRHLRAKGLVPLTREELRARGAFAEAWLARANF